MLTPAHTPLVVATRNRHIERIHHGSLVVSDTAGAIVTESGAADAYVFSRSTLKPFQALPLLRDGGQQYFGLSPTEIAITCASHSGEQIHIDTVDSLLKKVGRVEADLQCGCQVPLHYGESNLPPAGSRFDQRHNNCSGKHVGFLGFCALHGHGQHYLEPDHPLQEDIRRSVARLAGVAEARLWSGIDGCSAPNYGMPLSSLARLWARLAAGDSGIDSDYDKALQTAATAMADHPQIVSGTGRCDQAIAQASAGDCIGKVGADGIYTVAVRSRGLGLAVKIADGGLGALYVTAVRALVQLGLVAEHPVLAPWIEGHVRSVRGELVGQLESRFELARL